MILETQPRRFQVPSPHVREAQIVGEDLRAIGDQWRPVAGRTTRKFGLRAPETMAEHRQAAEARARPGDADGDERAFDCGRLRIVSPPTVLWICRERVFGCLESTVSEGVDVASFGCVVPVVGVAAAAFSLVEVIVRALRAAAELQALERRCRYIAVDVGYTKHSVVSVAP